MNLAVLFVVMTVMAGIPTKAEAAVLSDVSGHWAQSYILSGVNRGYISGYTDGTFRPNNPVSRAEFTKMLNQAIGLTRMTNIGFTDVHAGNWYYDAVRQGVAAGYISGYSDGSFRADSNISRQEAAVILSRIITPATSLQSVSGLADYKNISEWALDSVRTVFSKGYISGDPNRNFNPGGNLSRGEAAKLIEMLLGGETIVNANQVITVDNQTCNGTIYTGTVTVAGNVTGTTTFYNCKILGQLQLDGGGITVLNNTSVVAMHVAAQTTVTAVGSSTIKDTTVSAGCTLQESSTNSGDGFVNVKLEGSALVDSTVNLAGKFDTVTVNNRCNLNLTSGSIEKLIISTSAAGSKVDLAKDTRVAHLDVNGTATFTGQGKITVANVIAAGVTFETQPDNTPAQPGVLVPAINPANGAMNVSTTAAITLTFYENIYTGAREPLTAAYIQNSAIELRQGSETGPVVPFTGSVNGAYRIITITPTNALSEGTTYYVVLKPSLTSPSGQMNTRQVFSFSTGGGSISTWSDPASIPPKQATGIAATSNVTLTFPDAIYDIGGGQLTPAYLQSYVIQMRESTTQGTPVYFSATIDSGNRVITITPSTQLKQNTRYYVNVLPNTLQNTFGTKNTSGFDMWFTCGADQSVLTPTFTPARGASNVPASTGITLSFNEAIYTTGGVALAYNSSASAYLKSTVLALREDNASSGRIIDFTASISADGRTIQMQPTSALTPGKTYWVILQDGSLKNVYGMLNHKQEAYFTVQSGGTVVPPAGTLPTPTITPGGSLVSVDSAITMQFVEPVFTAGADYLSAAYLTDFENGAPRLRLQRIGNPITDVPYTVTISTDQRTLTIRPVGGLEGNTSYYLSMQANVLLGYSLAKNAAFGHNFYTNATGLRVNTAVGQTDATIYVGYDVAGTFSVSINGPGKNNELLMDNYTAGSAPGTFSKSVAGLTPGGTYVVTVVQRYASGAIIVANDTFVAQNLDSDATLAIVYVKDDVKTHKITVENDMVYTLEDITAISGQVELQIFTSSNLSKVSVPKGLPALVNAATSSTCRIQVKPGMSTPVGITVHPQSVGTPTKTYTINLHVNSLPIYSQ